MADDASPLPPEQTPSAPTPPPPSVPGPSTPPIEPQAVPEIPAIVAETESVPTAPEISIPESAEVIPTEAETAQVEAETAQTARNEPFSEAAAKPPEAPREPAPQLSPAAGNAAKQNHIQKKLARIMEMFRSQDSISNDGVEKILHCSDATATRYLSILEKEGRIVQTGKTGKSVVYKKR